MERQNLHSANSNQQQEAQAPRQCQAQLTEACRSRGGLLEPGRRSNAELCRDCAKHKDLERSKRWKRNFRRSPEPDKGWRVYHRKYSPYVSEEHRLECQRDYQRDRRKRLRSASEQQRAEALK